MSKVTSPGTEEPGPRGRQSNSLAPDHCWGEFLKSTIRCHLREGQGPLHRSGTSQRQEASMTSLRQEPLLVQSRQLECQPVHFCPSS